MSELVLAFDVGNTRVKVGSSASGGPDWIATDSVSHDADLGDWLARFVARHGERRCSAAIASVNQEMSDRLRGQLSRQEIPIRLIIDSPWLLAHTDLRCDLEAPATAGVDRLLSAIAALQREPGRAVIVIDCGSAITVNLTTADRVFRGGAILPGVRLMAEALAAGTAALPRVHLDGEAKAVGRSTVQAIRSGIHHAITGGVERLVGRMVADLPKPPAVYLTGGDAPLVRRGLGLDCPIAPHLVLEGLVIALAEMRRGKADRGA